MRLLISLFVVAALATAALGNQGSQLITSNIPWSLTLEEYYYDQAADETVFHYKVESSEDVARVIIAGCNESGALANHKAVYGPFWYTSDKISNLNGYSWLGQDASDGSKHYWLRLHGARAAENVNYAVHGNDKYSVGSISGASCSSEDDFPPVDDSVIISEQDCLVYEFNNDTDVILSHEGCDTRLHVRRTITATSNDGLVTKLIFDFHVLDNHLPEFIGNITDASYECYEEIPPPVDYNATSPCGNPVEVLDCEEEITTGECPVVEYRTRTYTAIDSCGNKRCKTQVITVLDNEGPTLTPKPNSTELNCPVDVADVPVANVTASDLCDGEVAVSHNQEVIDGECGSEKTIINYWTATDSCGNTDSHQQIISIVDNEAPVFEPSELNPVSFQCISELTDQNVTAYDECDDSEVDVSFNASIDLSSITNDICSVQFTRTWTACDACGNQDTLSQLVTIVDTQKPTFPSQPQGDEYECGEEVPPGDLNAEDNCAGIVPVSPTDTQIPTECPNVYSVDYLYFFEDACGNNVSFTITNNVVDTTPAFLDLSGIELNASYICGVDEIPQIEDYLDLVDVLPDNSGCDNSYNLSHSVVEEPANACNRTVTWTFVSTDCSGNNDTKSVSFEIIDNVPPEILGEPTDLNISVYCELPNAPVVNVSDACDGFTEELPHSDEEINRICTGTFTVERTWTRVDECDNEATVTQIINVYDDRAPEFDNSTLPSNITVNCTELDGALAEEPDITAFDDCMDQNVDVNQIEEVLVYQDTACPAHQIWRQTWEACDDCNNCVTYTRWITSVDNTAPVISPKLPEDQREYNLSCDEPLIVPDLCVNDDCSNVTFEFNRYETPDPNCPQAKTVELEWTAMDDCGNSDAYGLIIHVYDNEGPSFANDTDDAEANCTAGLAAANALAATGLLAVDNCAPDELVYGTVQTPTAICTGVYVFPVVWTYSDECNEPISVTHYINESDTTPPVIVYNGEFEDEFECQVVVPDFNFTVSDDCSGTDIDFLTSFDANSDRLDIIRTKLFDEAEFPDCESNYTDNYYLSAEDACGNIGYYNFSLTALDTEAPEFNTTNHEDITVDCNSVPPMTAPPVSDDCSAVEIIDSDESEDNSSDACANRTITRTWVARDACGHETTHVQVITVIDTTAPNVTYEFENGGSLNLTCEDTVPSPYDVCAADDCSNTTVTFTPGSSGDDCLSTITWSWTAVDECGNAAEPLSFEINIRDDIAPTFNGEIDVNNPYDCNYVLPSHPGCTDSCGNGGNDNRIEGDRENESCDGSFDVPVYYSCSDDCGNIDWRNVTLNIRDTTDPEFLTTPPAEASYDCEAGSFNPPTFQDDCSSVSISNTTDTDDLGDDCVYTWETTYVWTITDDCGNNDSFTRVETVGYNESLLHFSADPQDGAFDCTQWNQFNPDGVNGASFGVGVLTATDGCDNNAEVNRSEPTIAPGCGPLTGTKTYVWTATDVCGYSITVDAVANFTDTTAPTSNSATSSSVTNECEIQGIDDPIANDDCDDTPDVELISTTVNLGDDNCNYTFDVVREYELSDDCGNTAPFTHTQSYSWTPSASIPVFTLSEEQEQWLLEICETVGRNGNNVINFCQIKCQNFYGALEPNVTLLYDAVDRCDEPLEVEYDGTDNDEYVCPNIRTELYRFRTTDHCNVSATFTFTVEIIDTESPQVSPLDLPSINAECGDPSIPLPRVYATDNCPGVTLEYSSEDTDFDADDCCSFKRIRRWIARDACNITSNVVEQVISFRDTLPPNFTEPENYVIECPDPFPELEPPTAYEAPLALYHCVDLDNSAGSTECFDGTGAPLCGPDANTPAPAFSLSDPSDSSSSVGFRFVDNSFVVKYAWGELLIEGLVESLDSSNTRFHLWLELSGRLQSSDVVNSGSVLDCLSDACSAGVDKTVWTYYNSSRGYLLQDDGGVDTNVVNVTLDHRSSPGYSQYGVGAIGVNIVQQQLAFFLTYNATGSGSLPSEWNLPALGNADGRVVLENTGEGSCEVDLEDYPELICNRTLNVTQFKNVTEPGDCPGEYQVFIYYWAEDEAGNTAMTVQTVTVKDNTSPYFISTPPTVVSDECEEPELVPPVAVDNCTEVSSHYNETEKEVSPDCERNYEFQRQWYFFDECENPLTFIQTVVVNDDEPAELNGVPQEPLVYECDEEVIIPDANATDNCVEFGPITPVVTQNTTDGDCPYAYTLLLTYTADDGCNPPDVETATVIVQDTTAPDWVNDGTSTSNACVSTSHTPPTGSDNCGDAIVTPSGPTTQYTSTPQCEFNKILTYTYSLEDECGNVNGEQKVLTEEVFDNTPPTWDEDSLPQDRNATCREEIVTPPTPNATDNCVENPVTVVLTGEETIPLSADCPYNYDIVYTWEACDSCGNCVPYSATVSVRDNEAPELCLSGTGGDLGECEKPSNSTEEFDCLSIPPPVSICGYDNCDNVTVSFEFRDEPADNTCDYHRIYSWTATDACGLTDDLVIVHHIVDDLAPQWDVIPSDDTLDCTSDAEPADPTFTEDCNPGGSLNRSVSESNSTCPLVKVFTWVVSDACGNENTTSVTYTYVDNTDPYFIDFPDDQLGLDCTLLDATMDAEVNFSYDDDCHEVTLDGPVWSNQTVCPGNASYTRTWTITDECGNDAQDSYTVSFFDTTPPDVEDAADTRACNETELIPDNYMDFSDDCSSATPNFVGSSTTGDDDECPSTFVTVYTFDVSDECGNTVQWTFTETVTNPFDIVWDFIPENDVINCTDLEDYEPQNATASHPCVDIVVERTGPVESPVPGSDCPNDYRLTWTFTATDNCGHSDSVEYYVDVLDNTEPHWDDVNQFPPTERVNCTEAISPPINPDASDDCGHNVTVSHTEDWDNSSAPCTYVLTRTYSACDDCGNCITRDTTHIIVDEIDPTIDVSVAPGTYECVFPGDSDFTVDASDSCTDVSTTHSDDHTTPACDSDLLGTWTRTYTAEDECGNTASDSVTFVIEDTTDPYFVDTPNEIEYAYCADVPAPFNVTADDNCTSATVELIIDEAEEYEVCANYTITRVWTATDACGNDNNFTQVINVYDDVPPVFSPEPTPHYDIACNVSIPLEDICVSDACSQVNFSFSQDTDVVCPGHEFTIYRHLHAIDGCGNEDSREVVINVTDPFVPEFDLESLPAPYVNYSCEVVIPEPILPNASHPCGGEVTVDVEESERELICGVQSYRYNRTFTATDSCNNTNVYTQEIEVYDDTAPEIIPRPPVCYEWLGFNTTHQIYQIERNFRFWSADDLCGEDALLNFTVLSCTSNQDDEFGLVVEDGFTEHCYYENGNLFVLMVASNAMLDSDTFKYPGGRLYEVVGQVTDECGNSANATRIIWVPLNDQSGPYLDSQPEYDIYNISFTELAEEGQCLPVDLCVELCPCEYSINTCNDVDEGFGLELISRNVSDGQTEFFYSFTAPSALVRASVISLGLDLTEATLADAEFVDGVSNAILAKLNDDLSTVFIGRALSTLVEGVHLASSFGDGTLSFKLQGEWSLHSNSLYARIQFAGSSEDCNGLYVDGPGVRLDAPSDSISGNVVVSDFRSEYSGFIEDTVLPSDGIALKGVVVRASSGGDSFYALTDLNGAYSFAGLPSGTYDVQALAVPSSLLASERPYLFLGGLSSITSGDPFDDTSSSNVGRFGPAKSVSTPGSANFGVLLNDRQWNDPNYEMPQLLYLRSREDDYFNGNGRSASYWVYQIDQALSGSCPSADYSETLLNAYNAALATLVEGCDAPADLSALRAKLLDADANTRDLYTAALNQAAGLGVLPPYQSVAEWIIRLSAYEICDRNDGNAATIHNNLQALLLSD